MAERLSVEQDVVGSSPTSLPRNLLSMERRFFVLISALYDENILGFLSQNGNKKVWPENISNAELDKVVSPFVFYRAQE